MADLSAPDEIEVASIIYDALRRGDRNAHIQGDPARGLTTVDGNFNLRLVASAVLSFVRRPGAAG